MPPDNFDESPPRGKVITSGYASRATVEQYHEDNQRATGRLDDRLRKLEVTNERQLTKLEEIGKTLDHVEKRVEAKPIRWVTIVSVIVPIIGLVVVWVWQAARYPERNEFNRLADTISEMRLKFERLEFMSTIHQTKLEDLSRQIRPATP